MEDQIQLPVPLTRKIIFAEDVTQQSIEKVSSKIIGINANDTYLKQLYKIHNLDYNPKPIEIYIDSYGGYVYQIMGLISLIRNSITPVHTYVTGCAMSCGFLLLINGHKRFAYPLSTVLYHSVSNWHVGQVQDLEEGLEETRRLQKMIEDMTLDLTNITKKKLKEIKERKIDWFITAHEALKLSIVDEII